jgi:hypothetical protein
LATRAIEWLDGTDPDRPFFVFVNFFDAHWPYAPPDHVEGFGRFREPVESEWWDAVIREERTLSVDERAVLVDRYDSELRYMDGELGRLLAAAKQRAAGSGVLIVVTADHGEAFGEGGRYLHNYWLSEELTRVPLIVRYPDGRRAGEDDDALIQLTDVHDLILDELCGSDCGRPPARAARSFAFAELYRSAGAVEHFGARFDRNLKTVADGARKLELSTDAAPILSKIGEAGFADLAEHPVDRPSETDEATLTTLLAELERHLGKIGFTPPDGPELDSETRELLRALGYVD